jgi:hypothetical protein
MLLFRVSTTRRLVSRYQCIRVEFWDNKFLRNTGMCLLVYTASQSRRTSSSQSWEPQILKFLTIQFSPGSCHFIPLRFKRSPQHPVLCRTRCVPVLIHGFSTSGQPMRPVRPACVSLIGLLCPSAWCKLVNSCRKTCLVKAKLGSGSNCEQVFSLMVSPWWTQGDANLTGIKPGTGISLKLKALSDIQWQIW